MTCQIIKRPTEKPEKGMCWRCGKPVGKYRRKWCGEDCAMLYWRNHAWDFARDEAIRRAQKNGVLCCARCGTSRFKPEVNHINPRNGKGYGNGCWNHQENLEVLCHPCHLETTRMQRLARLNPQLPLLKQ